MGREIGISSDLFSPLERIFFFFNLFNEKLDNFDRKMILVSKTKSNLMIFLRLSTIHINYYNLKPSIYVSFVSILWCFMFIVRTSSPYFPYLSIYFNSHTYDGNGSSTRHQVSFNITKNSLDQLRPQAFLSLAYPNTPFSHPTLQTTMQP